MKTILFQGDSITDVRRDRNEDIYFGSGYATMAAGWVGCEYPGEYRWVNRAVSGDRVTDLYARVREDIVNVQPDILSILVGVNDVWSQYKYNRGNNTAKFERIYDLLLDEVCTELPEMKLMLLEPYVLNGPGTCSDAESPGRWEYMQKEVAAKSDVVKGLAEKYHAVFVPLQAALNEAAEKVSVEYWLYDGVHPTSAGHDLIKRQWVKGFERLRASEA